VPGALSAARWWSTIATILHPGWLSLSTFPLSTWWIARWWQRAERGPIKWKTFSCPANCCRGFWWMHSRRQNTRLSSHTSLSLVSPNHPICTSHPSFPISVFPLFPFLLLSDGFRLATTRFKPTAHTLFDIAARLPAGQIPEPLSASLYARVAVNKGNPTRDIESAPGKIKSECLDTPKQIQI